jgi:hypothetical protein
LALLDDWESKLLSTVTFLYDPFNLASLLEMSNFKACSDGSAAAYIGTYGWVLCLEDGTHLAHGSGPVDGNDPRSFRAEGQGMLSVMCFLHCLSQWTHATSTFTGTFATDNTGLIARIETQRALKYPVPNATFKPDWDVVQAIVDTMHSFSVEATFEYVRGHQDEKTPFSEFPLLAKLNVEADRYAGTHRDLHGRNCPIIPLSTTRPVALDIDGKTIHRGFKQAIRDAIHAPHLLEAMQIRYDWPDSVLETIDWEAHRQALQSQSNRRTHFVKLCHDILPTGSVVCRYGQGLPSYCALCSTPDENFAHVLCCPHPTRAKWRSEFIVRLRKKCHNLSTDQWLIDILLSSIESWLTQTHFDSSEFPLEYQTLEWVFFGSRSFHGG